MKMSLMLCTLAILFIFGGAALDTPAPEEVTPAPEEVTPAPEGDTPAPAGNTPAPAGDTPVPAGNTPAPGSSAGKNGAIPETAGSRRLIMFLSMPLVLIMLK